MLTFANRTPADARPFRHAKLTVRPAAVPIDLVAWRLVQAHFVLHHAAAEYTAACKWLGEANRRLSPKHRGSGGWSIEIGQAWVRAAFIGINRWRAALRTAPRRSPPWKRRDGRSV